jgi:hypothetical protein
MYCKLYVSLRELRCVSVCAEVATKCTCERQAQAESYCKKGWVIE